jgi:hypothetical protein
MKNIPIIVAWTLANIALVAVLPIEMLPVYMSAVSLLLLHGRKATSKN